MVGSGYAETMPPATYLPVTGTSEENAMMPIWMCRIEKPLSLLREVDVKDTSCGLKGHGVGHMDEL